METYILDTNFFFNLEIKSGFGKNPKEIIIALTIMSKELKRNKSAAFYMPPRILDELLTFVNKEDDYVQDFLSTITIQSPDSSSMQFSADVFYEMVDEIRRRSYRGLQIAEEELDNVGKNMMGKEELTKVHYQKTIGEHVTKLRERYRHATRFKFLDSVADLDIIVLAKELNGTIVSSDEGVLLWGRLFGVKEVVPQTLKKQLEILLEE